MMPSGMTRKSRIEYSATQTRKEELEMDENDLSRLVKKLLVSILSGIVSATGNPRQNTSHHLDLSVRS